MIKVILQKMSERIVELKNYHVMRTTLWLGVVALFAVCTLQA